MTNDHKHVLRLACFEANMDVQPTGTGDNKICVRALLSDAAHVRSHPAVKDYLARNFP